MSVGGGTTMAHHDYDDDFDPRYDARGAALLLGLLFWLAVAAGIWWWLR